MSWIRRAIVRDPYFRRSILGMCEQVMARWLRRKIIALPYEVRAATARLRSEHSPGGNGLGGYWGVMFFVSSIKDADYGYTEDIIYRIPERLFTTKKQRTDRREAMAVAVKFIAKTRDRERYVFRYFY